MEEDKQLLLKDLSGRLPYGVIGYINENIRTLEGINILENIVQYDIYCSADVEEFKPYLFPFSSMTIKQKAELAVLVEDVDDMFKSLIVEVDFYNKYHFDYRGLIEKGLAIDATKLNIY